MLPATYTIEKGRARLELPQISASIIYDMISDLKRFPPCKVGAAELP
jgi:predicted DNA-binding transcriptional regulator AlpA